jgi:hypothetical protein
VNVLVLVNVNVGGAHPWARRGAENILRRSLEFLTLRQSLVGPRVRNLPRMSCHPFVEYRQSMPAQ